VEPIVERSCRCLKLPQERPMCRVQSFVTL